METFEGSPHMVSDDGSVADKSAISQWGKFFEEGGKTLGRTFLVVEQGIQRKAMEEAGFVDIQEWEFKVSASSSCGRHSDGDPGFCNETTTDQSHRRLLLAAGPATRS